ncbi:hypothetical protein [Arthrobacter sp. ES1]|uniref:hypothetical protein n=1 Tax=Arthrobacter sp. ES1 TaxID=1897056 RepID=UPI001CFFD333|nr:hypothetical protein [Arthrobacter sp. ES1]MCB5280649.1 hypothetical protein [Arthrobacter sp. ES1]
MITIITSLEDSSLSTRTITVHDMPLFDQLIIKHQLNEQLTTAKGDPFPQIVDRATLGEAFDCNLTLDDETYVSFPEYVSGDFIADLYLLIHQIALPEGPNDPVGVIEIQKDSAVLYEYDGPKTVLSWAALRKRVA